MRIFKLTRNEQWGLLGLLVIFVGLFSWTYYKDHKLNETVSSLDIKQDVTGSLQKQKPPIQPASLRKVSKPLQKDNFSGRQSTVLKVSSKFYVNQATHLDWESIGVPTQIAKRCQKFIFKRGGVTKIEDLNQVYGFKKEWVSQISPFADLSFKRIDINVASVDEFKLIHGVGDILSKRILKYRALLGGFVEVDQLKEVYGLEDLDLHQKLLKIEVSENVVHKFDPKKVGLNELFKHPYITKEEAKKIITLKSNNNLTLKTMEEIVSNKKALKYFKWKD